MHGPLKALLLCGVACIAAAAGEATLARPAMAQDAPAAQSAEAYLAEAQAAMDSMLAGAEEFRAEGDCDGVQAILETIQNLITSERAAHPEYPASLFDGLQAQLDGAAAPECPWTFPDPWWADGALTYGDLGLQLVLDSEDWCEYGPSQPQGDAPGDDPRDANPGDGSDPRDDDPGDSDDPRDGPPPMPELTDWGDLEAWIKEVDEWTWLSDPANAETLAMIRAWDWAYAEMARMSNNDDPADAPEEEAEEQDDPRDAPTVTLIVKATDAAQTGIGQAATGRQQVKLFAESVQNVALPSEGGDRPQTDAGADPMACTTGDDGQCEIEYALDDLGPLFAEMEEEFADALVGSLQNAIEVIVNPAEVTSYTIEVAAGTPISVVLQPYTISTMTVGDSTFVTLMAPTGDVETGWIQTMAGYQVGVIGVEENFCRDKQPGPPPPDPLMQGAGSWGQRHDDQWAIKRVGLTLGADSAWSVVGADPRPVTVAVIDTGLDWNHLDFSYDNIWRNPGETPDNGVDDDGNGYVDDVIGWDFMAGTNNPWDHDGHGTIVAGIIAADTGNDIGIAGINPHARIMVLKALNAFGHTRASYVAEAIVYAADNGARVINLSVGGPTLTRIEAAAIAHARSRGAVVVVAAGNEGVNVSEFGLAGADGVLTVGATNLDDSHPNFSNWGAGVDIAAPGVDVLSLRARRTDTMLGIKDVPYEAGAAYVGEDRRYYRVSGTSFSAPIVTGVASLILSARPDLTADQVEAILVQSAQDIQTPGVDQFSGAGMVDARAALQMDPAFRIEASITGLEVVQTPSGPAVRVMGAVGADRFRSARIDVGRGEQPTAFSAALDNVSAGTGALGDIPADTFRGASVWTVRLVVTHADGRTRQARYVLDVGG